MTSSQVHAKEFNPVSLTALLMQLSTRNFRIFTKKDLQQQATLMLVTMFSNVKIELNISNLSPTQTVSNLCYTDRCSSTLQYVLVELRLVMIHNMILLISNSRIIKFHQIEPSYETI